MKRNEILTRFELFVDKDSQGVGFLRGLEDAGISEDLQRALEYPFIKKLTVPSTDSCKSSEKDKKVLSYFTELGLTEFKEPISKIVDEINYEGLFSVGKIEVFSRGDNETYSDKYQVLLKSFDLTDITSLASRLSPGIYNFVPETNANSFYKYKTVPISKNVNLNISMKVYPDCLSEDYYNIDLDKSLIEII
mgnify:CR=1 FL=1